MNSTSDQRAWARPSAWRPEPAGSRRSTAQLMLPQGTVDESSIATGAGHGTGRGAVQEIKEWQAIMDHLRNLPVKDKGELPVIPVDERAAEVRAVTVKVG
jgi:5'-nucleotidase/UDP-sugar diphosphatase